MKQEIKNIAWTTKRIFHSSSSSGAYSSKMFWTRVLVRDIQEMLEGLVPPLQRKLEHRRALKSRKRREESQENEIVKRIADHLSAAYPAEFLSYYKDYTNEDREWFCTGGWLMSEFTDEHNEELIDKCNFDFIFEDLAKEFGHDVEILPHPAHNYTNVICYNSSNANLVRKVAEIEIRLENYPIYDEDRFSEVEDKIRWENWESWGKHDLVCEVEKLVQAFLVILGVEQTPVTMWQFEDTARDETRRAFLEKLRELWFDEDCGQSYYSREDLLDVIIEQVKKEWKEK